MHRSSSRQTGDSGTEMTEQKKWGLLLMPAETLVQFLLLELLRKLRWGFDRLNREIRFNLKRSSRGDI
jgi:hypothetical protein